MPPLHLTSIFLFGQPLKAPARTPEARRRAAEIIRFSLNGSVVVVNRPADLIVYDLVRGTFPYHQHNPHTGDDCSDVVALSPDGRWLAQGGRERRTILLRDLRVSGHAEAPKLCGHVGDLTDLTFSPDGTLLVSASRDGSAVVWDLAVVLAIPHDRPVALSEGLWEKLASDDGETAGQAMRELKRVPAQAIPLLKGRLRPVVGAPARARLDRLIADLDAARYEARTEAARELARWGDLAGLALRAALAKKLPLEQTRRIEQLLQRIDALEASPERLRVVRAIEVLERIGTSEARAVLAALASGAADAQQTWEAKASLARLRER